MPDDLDFDFSDFSSYDPRDPWQDRAACAQGNWEQSQIAPHNPEVFFPQRQQGGQCAPAKSVCGPCPVKVQCLKAGLREPFGVWGGLSEKERREAHRMHKKGMTIEAILEVFSRREPKRKRKATLPMVVSKPMSEDEIIAAFAAIPQQREVSEAEQWRADRARELERRRNGL